jgi:hypothetical protein
LADEHIRTVFEAIDKESPVIRQLIRSYLDYQDGLDKTSSAQKKVGQSSQSLEGALGKVKGALGALGVSLAARELIQLSAGMVQAGAAASRAEFGFKTMSGSMTAAAQNMEAMREATNGTIDDMVLARVGAQLMGTGLASTADEMSNMVRVATILGGTFRGLGAEDAAGEFALMLQNIEASTQRLDSFGISAAQVRARAAELVAANANLSSQQARQAAVMEIATARADELSGALTDQQATIDQLRTEWVNFRQDASQAFADFAIGTLNTQRSLTQQRDEVIQSTDSFAEYIAAWRESGGEIPRVTQKVYEHIKAEQELQQRLDRANESSERLATQQLAQAKAQEAAAEAAEVYERSLTNVNSAALSALNSVLALQAGLPEGVPLRFAVEEDVLREGFQSFMAGLDLTEGEQLELKLGFAVDMGDIEPQIADGLVGLSEFKATVDALPGSIVGFKDIYLAAWEEIIAGGDAANAMADAQRETVSALAAEMETGYTSGQDHLANLAVAQDQFNQAAEGAGGTVAEQAEAMAKSFTELVEKPAEFATAMTATAAATAKPVGTIIADIEKMVGGLEAATTEVEDLAFAIASLKSRQITVAVTVAGGAAGGGTFFTSGPTALIVGDNPGGVERVQVTPISGRGRTTVSPGSGLVSAAGGATIQSGGGVVHNHYHITEPIQIMPSTPYGFDQLDMMQLISQAA